MCQKKVHVCILTNNKFAEAYNKKSARSEAKNLKVCEWKCFSTQLATKNQ